MEQNTEERNCAFQYAKVSSGIFSDTKIVADVTDLTLQEAKTLFSEHYSDAAKHIKNGGTVEMVIWTNMVDNKSYGSHLQYIDSDAASDGIDIWVERKEYFPKYPQPVTT
jgi:hypothetical protein